MKTALLRSFTEHPDDIRIEEARLYADTRRQQG